MNAPSTTDGLVLAASREPLAEVLPLVRSAARRAGDDGLLRWTRFEASGYYPENAEDGDARVPDYRDVRVRYVDARKRPIRIPDGKVRDVVSRQSLPQPAGTLERLAAGDDRIFLSDPPVEDFLRRNVGIDPVDFCVRPEAVSDVVHAIRDRLIDELEDRREVLDEVHLPQLSPDEADEGGGGVLTFLFGSVWRILILAVAGLIVAYLTWRLGW